MTLFWFEKCLFLWFHHELFLKGKKCASHFAKKPQLKINCFKKKQKLAYSTHTWSDKALKGTILNRALISLPGRSIEITVTVPLMLTLLNIIKLFCSFCGGGLFSLTWGLITVFWFFFLLFFSFSLPSL